MLLLSRSMLTQPADIFPLKTLLAFAALALFTNAANAGRVRSAGQEPSVQVSLAQQASASDVDADTIDAERVFQSDSAAPRNSAISALAGNGELSTLPSSDEFNATGTGELRGKELHRAMADLPQVGASSNTLSLEFWDDATSARSAVDDRSVRAGEASQGNGRSGHSNVMIPLPMAAWSALSVLGGVGFVSGIRKVARRFR